jgi:phosphatidate cytidylyltransferase
VSGPVEVREGTAGSAMPPDKKRWALGLRVVSGILFVPLLILLARAGGLVFLAFVAVEVTLGMTEFYGMMRGRGHHPHMRFGLLVALGVLWMCYRPWGLPADALATAALMLVLIFGLRRPERSGEVESMAVTALGVLYVGWLSAHLVLLRELPWRAGTEYGEGMRYVLLAFLVTWSCDTAAYGVGRVLGRTRPWKTLSPRKSVEGAAGGLVAAVAAAFVARAWFAPFLSVRDALILGALVGVIGQVGDFVESLLKRQSSHGDSSNLIPGHGGVLDRFDSLYFAAPVVYYYLRLVVFGAP